MSGKVLNFLVYKERKAQQAIELGIKFLESMGISTDDIVARYDPSVGLIDVNGNSKEWTWECHTCEGIITENNIYHVDRDEHWVFCSEKCRNKYYKGNV